MKTAVSVRKILVALCVLASLCAWSGPAQADQFAYIPTRKAATEAVNMILASGDILKYCEPCKDKVPVYDEVDKLSVELGDNSFIYINEDQVDLAYIFVRSHEKDKWLNVALAVGLKADDVSEYIMWSK
jgi:hypothetical protein